MSHDKKSLEKFGPIASAPIAEMRFADTLLPIVTMIDVESITYRSFSTATVTCNHIYAVLT